MPCECNVSQAHNGLPLSEIGQFSGSLNDDAGRASMAPVTINSTYQKFAFKLNVVLSKLTKVIMPPQGQCC